MTEQTKIKHLLIIVHSRSGTNQALGQAVVEEQEKLTLRSG